LFGDVTQPLVQPHVLGEVGVGVDVEAPAGVDQVLKLVHESSGRTSENVRSALRVGEHAGTVWRQHIEHLADVASGAALEGRVGGLRKEVASLEETADHAVRSPRRQLVYFLGEEDEDLAVVI